MKSILISMAAFAVLAGSSLAQSDPPGPPSSIETRLRQIDLDVAIKHYEKLLIMMRETRLERDLKLGTLEPDKSEVDLTERKMLIIDDSISKLKNEIKTISSGLEITVPPPLPQGH